MDDFAASVEELGQEGAAGIGTFIESLGSGGPAVSIITAVVLTLFALFSYKIYKAAIIIVGAALLGGVGYMYISPWLAEVLGIYEAWLPIAVTVVCAVIGAGLMKLLQKIAVFIAGAALGYFLGTFLNTAFFAVSNPEFFSAAPGNIIVPIVCALICGVISGFAFKLVFILGTSVVSMIAAVTFVGNMFGLNATVAMIIGAVLGLMCAAVQFKMNKGKK